MENLEERRNGIKDTATPVSVRKSDFSSMLANVPDIDSLNEESQDIIKNRMSSIREMSKIFNECCFVIDIRKKQFLQISEHKMFLCGKTPDEIFNRGLNHFEDIMPPDELEAFAAKYLIIIQHLLRQTTQEDQDAIKYYAFHAKHKYRDLTLMMYYKIRPVFIDNIARRFVCTLVSSVRNKCYGIEIHYNNSSKYDFYNYAKKRWEQIDMPTLSSRETQILLLASHGKMGKEIADLLGVKEKTIRNIEQILYSKLQVNSLMEAYKFSQNFGLL